MSQQTTEVKLVNQDYLVFLVVVIHTFLALQDHQDPLDLLDRKVTEVTEERLEFQELQVFLEDRHELQRMVEDFKDPLDLLAHQDHKVQVWVSVREDLQDPLVLQEQYRMLTCLSTFRVGWLGQAGLVLQDPQEFLVPQDLSRYQGISMPCSRLPNEQMDWGYHQIVSCPAASTYTLPRINENVRRYLMGPPGPPGPPGRPGYTASEGTTNIQLNYEDIATRVRDYMRNGIKIGGGTGNVEEVERLQKDLDRRREWAKKMEYNVGKCEIMHFGGSLDSLDLLGHEVYQDQLDPLGLGAGTSALKMSFPTFKFSVPRHADSGYSIAGPQGPPGPPGPPGSPGIGGGLYPEAQQKMKREIIEYFSNNGLIDTRTIIIGGPGRHRVLWQDGTYRNDTELEKYLR
eukprot:g48123.t1